MPFWNQQQQTIEQGTSYLTQGGKKNIFIDLKALVSYHGARQLGGQGLSFTSDNPQIQKLWDRISRVNRINDYFINIVEIANYWGAIFPILDKNNEGDWIFSFANPEFFNSVGRIDVSRVSASIYKQYSTGMGYRFERTVYTLKTISKMVATEEIATQNGTIVPPRDKQSIISAGETINPYGFIPVYRYMNKPNRIMIGNYYIINADDYPVRHIPDIVNHLYQQLWKEAIFNKSKAFLQLSPAQKAKMAREERKGGSSYFDADYYIEVDGTGEGDQKVTTVQGDPKFTQYLDAIEGLGQQYFEGCLYSSTNDKEQAQTKAETLFTKSKDIETSKYKRVRYVELLYEMFDDIFKFEGLMQEEEERPYAIDIKENIVHNEIQLTNLVVSAIENDLMTHPEAIERLRSLDPASAEEVFQNILTKNKEYINEMGAFQEELGDGARSDDANIDKKPPKIASKGTTKGEN